MPTISTIIITKNEAHNIEECIKSVLWTDEIVILDSGSTDGTQEICKKYSPKVKLHETDWPGFGPQKNRASKLATFEWVLSIDADERITTELREEILQELKKGRQHTGYRIECKSYFLNQPLNFCSKRKNNPIRLAKRDACYFSEDIIHEKMSANGKIGKLENHIDHFSLKDIEELLNKTNHYSSINATKLATQGKKVSIFKTIYKTAWTFLKMYFIRRGFLDGWPGFMISLNHAEGTFYKYAKLLEKQRQRN